MITSPHNEALKEVRKLAGRRWRDKLGEFVAEGEDLLDAADAAGWQATARYVAADSGLDGIPVAPHVLSTVSQLGSGTRAIGVYPQRWAAPIGPLCVALWGVNDPGNVGTVIRSALAFGASSVALGPGSADPYGPKAVRASMGAIFSVPVSRVRDVAELPGRRVALVAREGEPLPALAGHLARDGEPSPARAVHPPPARAADPPPARAVHPPPARAAHPPPARAAHPPCDDEPPSAPAGDLTFVVGAERDGLPEDVVASCDSVAHIPIARADSLNAAMAATVALYEMHRITRP